MQWRTLPRTGMAYGRRGWYTVGLRAVLRAGPWARAMRRINRWTLESADGRRGYISMDIKAPRLWSLLSERALADGQPRSLDLPAWVG